MPVEKKMPGVYKKENGYWEYRFAVVVNGHKIARKKARDENGNRCLAVYLSQNRLRLFA